MRFHGSLLLLLVAFVACLGTNSVAETSMRVNEVTQAIDVPSTEISHVRKEKLNAINAFGHEERFLIFLIIPSCVTRALSRAARSIWDALKKISGFSGTSGKKIRY
uniref:RxLR effector protein n=1 Tax=Hyaloperonospora arabidopsidis (strain Emoy2) TaxID=559515 RepID=M4BXP7_HYAAE